MDNLQNPYEPQESTPKPQVIYSPHDWLTLLFGLVLALIFTTVFNFRYLYGFVPGLGVPVFVLAYYLSVFLYLGKRAVVSAYTILLCASTFILSLCCFFYANFQMTAINCFLILALGASSAFALSGVSMRDWRQARIIPETIRLAFSAVFSYFFTPFSALAGLFKGKRSLGVLAGIVVCLPVLALVVYLLSSADAVFANIFTSLGDWLVRLNVGSVTWRVVKTAFYTLAFASALYFLTHPKNKEKKVADAKRRYAPALPVVTALTLLNIIYIVFVAIQFAFLFGGAHHAALSGGYAEYARSGFFQLVAVAIINLFAVLISVIISLQNGGEALSAAGKAAIRASCLLLLALTAVVLVSAAWRMSLYISVYGLSLLRLFTLWGMAVIAVCIVAAAVKTHKPGFKFFQVFAAFALASWILLSLSNVGGRIASYNVDAYINGEIEYMDTQYLIELSPDVMPALKRLYEYDSEKYSYLESPSADLYPNLHYMIEGSWTTYKLSYLYLD